MVWFKAALHGPGLNVFARILIVFIIVFELLAFSTGRVMAQSDGEIDTVPSASDNMTQETPPPHDIVIPQTPPDDTVQPSPVSDNVTGEETTPIERMEPDGEVKSISPDSDSEITSSSGTITLRVPKGAVFVPAEIEMNEYSPQYLAGTGMLKFITLDARDTSSGGEITHFNKGLEITIIHTSEELSGYDIDSLRLYYLDETTREWVPVADSRFDRETLVLTATLDHFSTYSEYVNPLVNGPGRVMSAQVDLHSGAAMYTYPIELPPGPGGFQPKLDLIYNSGSVDEMKNKRSVGSWVGTGWTLYPGRISYDLIKRKYYLEMNGASQRLFSSDGVNYRTQPESYIQITRSGNTWTMRDREGFYYRFGGNTDSEQYVYDHPHTLYYRWDLSLIRDTNNNQATVTYTQELLGNTNQKTVRSAYPEYMTYNNVQVHFITGYDEYIDAGDGYVRFDNPISYGSTNIAPKVMESRRLDAVEVKVSGNLLRKYTFSYTTTNRNYSTQYGGIYYSGRHILDSITQIGADGISTLPVNTFTYSNLQTYMKDTTLDTYGGNPGNPVSFTWPHLIEIDSGYGGSITFGYTQIPDAPANNIWTREVVTTKTVVGGINGSQTYSYTYEDGPRYYPPFTWDTEYRGFNKVTVTDAADNYEEHWFYTTGTIGGKDADKLTGREYETRWYDSSSTLLRAQTFDWSWEITDEGTELVFDYPLYVSSWDGVGDYGTLNQPQAIATDGSLVFVADTNHNRIVKYDDLGYYLAHWTQVGAYGNLSGPQGIAIYGSYLYVSDTNNNRIVKYNTSGTYITHWSQAGDYGNLTSPQGIDAISGYVYVADTGNNRVVKYDTNGNYITHWSAMGSGSLVYPKGVTVSTRYGRVYVSTGNNVAVYDLGGGYQYDWVTLHGQFMNGPDGLACLGLYVYVANSGGSIIKCHGSAISHGEWSYGGIETELSAPQDVAIVSDDYLYVADTGNNRIVKYYLLGRKDIENWKLTLDQVDETTGDKTARTRFVYDDYGNVISEYLDGDTSTADDDAAVHRLFYPNTTNNILNKTARERVYDSGENLIKETRYYYDGNNSSMSTPPDKGNLTRKQMYKAATSTVSNFFTYDSYGNMLTSQDPRGNVTTWTYDPTYHAYPATCAYPVTGLSESYTFDPGTNNPLSITGVNGQTTMYQYDTFKRRTKEIKPGDSAESPSVEYRYNNWGTINQQNIETRIKVTGEDYLWKKEFFDGLGRVIQTQARGVTGRTFIESTVAYDTRGMLSKEYVPQDLDSAQVDGYEAPETGWKYTSYNYDGLGRISDLTAADGTAVSHDYSTPWQDLVTNERGYKTRYYYDVFQRLVQVDELDAGDQVYATTEYGYNTVGDLVQVEDDDGNITSMTYDWLSRKTAMTDPDMGSWSYVYDNNSNLTTQTDAKGQTITMSYDAMDRLTGKTYPAGSGMTNVSYTYDSTTGGYGKGKRTGMADAAGTVGYTYDTRGRLVEEKRIVDSVAYTTGFAYDGADRLTAVTYPDGETVTQGYNGRGLPYSLSGNEAGSLVTGTLYNNLGQPTGIDFNNNVSTTFGYWDTGGSYDTTGGYYGRLWRIKTATRDVEPVVLQDVKHTWDAGGNLSQREDVLASETEVFGYDFLDRLTSVSGPYSRSYSYNETGNIVSKNSVSYTYGSQPHAVTSAGSTGYSYDANGNMTMRGGQTITWDMENRPVAVSDNITTVSFVYNGDGNRVIKTENGVSTLYVNKYYEAVGEIALATGNPPVITNSTGAGYITSISATLNGEVTYAGDENPDVSIFWGDSDGGADPYEWEYRIDLGTKGEDTFYSEIDNLEPETTYYYRCYAVNAAGADWADSTVSFTTLPPAVTRTLDIQVNAGSDDCLRCMGTVDTFYTTSTINRSGAGDPEYHKYGSGMRFTNVIIPEKSEVQSAFLTFTAKSNNSSQRYSYISAEKTLNAPTFSSEKTIFDVRFNNHTIAKVNYSDSVAWTAGNQYQSPDISDVISEVIAQTGWKRGNSLVLFWEDFDDRSANNRNRRAHSYESNPSNSPVLHIDYKCRARPEVISKCAGNITTTAARLNGEVLVYTGLEDPEVHIFWGDNNGGTNPAAWDNDINMGTKGIEAFYADINGLDPATTYYYRCYAINSEGEDWSNNTIVFTTLPAGAQTLDIPLSAGSDDCSRCMDTADTFSLVSDTSCAGAGDAGYHRQGSGMRFNNIAISDNIIIISAYLTFTAKNTNSNERHGYISAEKALDPASFGGDKAEFDTRFNNHTTAKVDYSGSEPWTADNQYQSPDISDVISEIIAQPGWESSNSIVLFWEDFDDRSADGGNRCTYSYDGDPAKAPVLHIEYTDNTQPPVMGSTKYYYLGDRLVAKNSGGELRYIHQDHLTGTALVTTEAGEAAGTMKYYPFGESRNSQGNVATDRLFTGQRLDDTGLYYYVGRYYDPSIGRFISADPFVQWSNGFDVVSSPLTVNAIPAGLGIVFTLINSDYSSIISTNLIKSLAPGCNYPTSILKVPLNPQALNRYSYVLNNPLKYIDTTGWFNYGVFFVGYLMLEVGTVWTACGVAVIEVPVASAVFELVAVAHYYYGIMCIANAIKDKGLPDLNDLNPFSESSCLPTFEDNDNSLSSDISATLHFSPNTNNTTSSSNEFTYYSYEMPQYDVNTGFTCWGIIQGGAEVWSMNDPSSYSWSDWYGYY